MLHVPHDKMCLADRVMEPLNVESSLAHAILVTIDLENCDLSF